MTRAGFRTVLDSRLARRTCAPSISLLGAGHDVEGSLEAGRDYLAAMSDGGWGTPSWPTEHGGAGLGAADLQAFEELLQNYERPDLYAFMIGLSTAGPMLMAHGTASQRARHLEPIRLGREIWCQLFSEPDAGSDLASLRTRAARDGDDWVVRGHKVWVSRAAVADWGLLLARTNPAEPRHRGITAFIVPMDAAGVATSPIRQMNGDRHFFEVFLDDVRLSDDLRLGPVDEGWRIAMQTVRAERAAGASLVGVGLAPAALAELVADSGASDDPVARQDAARAFALLTLLEVGRADRQPEGNKLLLATATRALFAVLRHVRGAGGMLIDRRWTPVELTVPSVSIRGGTDEVQRNLIAERVLGLPRDPRPVP